MTGKITDDSNADVGLSPPHEANEALSHAVEGWSAVEKPGGHPCAKGSGNPFAFVSAEEAAASLQSDADQRAQLRSDGPRQVNALPYDARSVATFSAAQRAMLGELVDEGLVQPLAYHGELFVTYGDIEDYIGPGYDDEHWLHDAATDPAERVLNADDFRIR